MLCQKNVYFKILDANLVGPKEAVGAKAKKKMCNMVSVFPFLLTNYILISVINYNQAVSSSNIFYSE